MCLGNNLFSWQEARANPGGVWPDWHHFLIPLRPPTVLDEIVYVMFVPLAANQLNQSAVIKMLGFILKPPVAIGI